MQTLIRLFPTVLVAALIFAAQPPPAVQAMVRAAAPEPAEIEAVPIPEYRFAGEKMPVRFEASLPTGIHRGEFKKYDIRAWIHPGDLRFSKILVTIDMTTMRMDSSFLDFAAHMAFNTAAFPEVMMATTDIRRTADPDVYETDLEFNLLGDSHRKTIHLHVIRIGRNVALKGAPSLCICRGVCGTFHLDMLLEPADERPGGDG
ncbi:YceI family protein [Elusimicrobiota bacterium]